MSREDRAAPSGGSPGKTADEGAVDHSAQKRPGLLKRALLALAAIALWLTRRRRVRKQEQEHTESEQAEDGRRHVSEAPRGGRIVPAGSPNRVAELWVVALLGLAALLAAGFVVVYAEFSPRAMPNQVLGACLGGALLSLALALVVFARRLIVTEQIEEDYPSERPEAQREVAQIVRESGSRITRRRLLVGAASAGVGALGVAGLTPLLSLGPLWDTTSLEVSPWYRGRRLVGADGKPLVAAEVEYETFYTAFPEGADPEQIGSPLVLVRMSPGALRLPAGRAGWAPLGILAYSRICTHAGCAIELYRKPRFAALEQKPALVCPCHYSTFDPATGARVIFGPAGRPLPQLPLDIDGAGHLRAAGDFSGRVGPAWWAVRARPS